MKISSFNYLIKQGFNGMYKNRLMSFASFCIMLVSLLMVGLSVLTTLNINRIIGTIEDKNEIVVVILDSASQEKIDALGKQIKGTHNVAEANLFSKDDAWKKLQGEMPKEEQQLFQYASSNPLPNTYRVRIEDISQLNETAEKIQSLENVESVQSPKDFADILVNMRTVVAVISTAIVAALIIVCMVIISNTTRASVFTRRKEINIMKYVGANNSFIRIPFFVEGMTIGVLSAVGALAATAYIYEAMHKVLTSKVTLQMVFGTSSIIPLGDIIVKVGIAYVIAGATIGALGSVFSTRKHLRV